MTITPITPPADLPHPLRPGTERALAAIAEAAEREGIAIGELGPDLPLVVAASPFVARSLARRPALLADLIDSGDLDHPYEGGVMAAHVAAADTAASDGSTLMAALRRLREREMVRIAWRDLAGGADLDETLGDLTALAEGCLDAAHDHIYEDLVTRHGAPRRADGATMGLAIIGMGKLGGRELNFSSDIDLIFAYAEEGETDGPVPIDYHSFFVKLGQRLIRALNEATVDGFVFRVDMRLRPFGESGPLAMGIDAMETYYQTHGREWERYALIKARAVAGDRTVGEELLSTLTPFVYRRYLDYGSFAALREMKALIEREAARKGMADDIKLGMGGIREVEFIGQAFQLIRGGRDTALRAREIRTILTTLVEQGLLPAWAEGQLLDAYGFLRRAENRLQEAEDLQTHRLPHDEEGRARLAWSMGYDAWKPFHSALTRHMRRVHGQFEQVFAAPQREEEREEDETTRLLAAAWSGAARRERAEEALAALGFTRPEAALTLLDGLRDSAPVRALTTTGRARLDALIPLLVAACADHRSSHGGEDEGGPDDALTRLLDLVRTIARRSVYLSLLVENPMALSQLVRLCTASPWIAAELTRHPILLDELLDPRTLYSPPDREGIAAELEAELAQVGADDLEQVMDRLRAFKQAQVLRVAAADVSGALPVMKVSDHLTWIAEVVLKAVAGLCWRQVATRYGVPPGGDQAAVTGFAIAGYGKLGGLELGYGSDLDLVFLYDGPDDDETTGGRRPVSRAEFCARLAQRIMHILGTWTAAGVLYETDTRLRPGGDSGLLVSSLHAFTRYQRESAWTWEHQALVRARAIAGDPKVSARFEQIRAEVLTSLRDPEAIRREVGGMREKMWREHASRDPARFDLKHDPGGIADIEFMVQYLVLVHAATQPGLVDYPDNIRILDTLAQTGLLPEDKAGALADTYRLFRDRIHALTLQGRPTAVPADEYAAERERVRTLWRRLMGQD